MRLPVRGPVWGHAGVLRGHGADLASRGTPLCPAQFPVQRIPPQQRIHVRSAQELDPRDSVYAAWGSVRNVVIPFLLLKNVD